MLEPAESQLVHRTIREGLALVKAEAQKRGRILHPMELTGTARAWQPMLEMYRLLTGFVETNPNAVLHHSVELYGPPCPKCRKPLRTPEARFCAACGFGQQEVTPNSLPLAQRRPELF
ncbi:zinc ribbon domain-containing protein [Hymenobacter chitinivorans]|uniref:Uncharacterized protein n=1 Tax=Hymenobacter chitinivorans DSM 11115 TaxID=1121954 RepID=A0A2M9BAN6_9BACT|nr:zinc ribbon domain-containing protein [Hymenobacter chitinivorans]PJJ55011.1 hypothetical protein CLV45_3360 [Hymenobacter chitinivorans DSM 11115]